MTRALIVASVLALAQGSATADPDPAPVDPQATLAQVREHFARGEYAEAQQLLETAYAATHAPALLFALGQVAFNLHRYDEAIAYYEKFLATGPDADQTALAQQAIGAARARIATPPPPPPTPAPPPPAPPEYRRRWTLLHTAGVALGGVGLVAGGWLIYRGHRLGYDDSGTLADYDRRIRRSERDQRAGLACGIGGALAIGVTLVIWGVREEEVPRVTPMIGAGGAGVTFGGAW